MLSIVFLIPGLRAQTTIADNLGRPAVGGVPFFSSGDAAANAFVPSIDGYLRSITVKLENLNGGAGSQAEVRLWSGNGNLPTNQIASLPAQSFSGNAPEDVQFDFAVRPEIEANTRYWVSVHYVSGDFDWVISSSGVPFGATFGTHLSELAASSNNGTSWSDDDSPGQPEFAKMRVLVDEHLVANTNDSGVGSLRDAINQVEAGGTITFSPSLSGQTITLTSDSLDIDKNLTIDASGLPNGITISGEGERRVFFISAGDVTLDTLTIRDGNAFFGGGIRHIDGNLTIRNSLITDCTADFGGGIDSGDGAVLLENSTITGNATVLQGGDGGGILVFTDSSLTINQSTIAGNTANGLGDNLFADGNVTATNSIIASAGDTTLTSSIDGAGTVSGTNNIIGMDPLLGPLADNGGPTQTMLPLPGSPMIDSGGASALATDQRGFTRTVGSAPDIGAAELQERIVTTDNDIDDGPFLTTNNGISLREAINHAEPGQGEIIRFAPSLSGQTIYLSSGQPLLVDRNVIIDGSTLQDAVTISGLIGTDGNDSTTSVFLIDHPGNDDEEQPGNVGHVSLSGLHIFNGDADGGIGSPTSDRFGGGIYQEDGTLTLNRITLANNAANFGGAIYSRGVLIINNSTIANNLARGDGGGLYAVNSIELNRSTIAGNEAVVRNGGIDNENSNIIANNTIISGNTAPISPNTQNSVVGSNNLINEATPRLGILQDNGGPLLTVRPMPGSPAIDGGFPDGITTVDQRGFARQVGSAPDIGAVELTEILVDTQVDETDGIDTGGISLRDAIGHNVPGEAEIIRFDPSMSGDNIRLNGTELLSNRPLIIDGSNLAEPVTLDTDSSEAAILRSEAPLQLRGLVFNGRNDEVVGTARQRGAVSIRPDAGYTYIERCTFRHTNGDGFGGAINSGASLFVDQSTFFGNESPSGAAIFAFPGEGTTVQITRSTFTDNRAAIAPAISVFVGENLPDPPTIIIDQCTISGNHATSANAEAVVVDNVPFFMHNTIIAGNYPLNTPQFLGDLGVSLEGTSMTEGDPLLAPLGDYGGPTQTMPPLPGSPVIDAGDVSSFTTDQRGLAMTVGSAADIGAVEYQGRADLARFFMKDFDNDGAPFGLEHALGTSDFVSDRNSLLFPTLTNQGASNRFTFGIDNDARADTVWIVKRATSLAPSNFVEIFRLDGPSGTESPAQDVVFDFLGLGSIVDSNPQGDTVFYLLEVQLAE